MVFKLLKPSSRIFQLSDFSAETLPILSTSWEMNTNKVDVIRTPNVFAKLVKMVTHHGKNHAHGLSKVIHSLVLMQLMPLVSQNNQTTNNQITMIHWIKIMLIWMLKINKIPITKMQTCNNQLTI